MADRIFGLSSEFDVFIAGHEIRSNTPNFFSNLRTDICSNSENHLRNKKSHLALSLFFLFWTIETLATTKNEKWLWIQVRFFQNVMTVPRIGVQKTHNPAGVDSGTPVRWPSVMHNNK